jgi:hypothetical protein
MYYAQNTAEQALYVSSQWSLYRVGDYLTPPGDYCTAPSGAISSYQTYTAGGSTVIVTPCYAP